MSQAPAKRQISPHDHDGVVSTEDERLGLLLKAIRRRVGLTQEELAIAAEVPVRNVAAVEDARSGDIRVDRLRAIFATAGGQARVTAWWNGAAADRLLDEKHAALVERAIELFHRRKWEVAVEVTFSEYGERGSIDVLGGFRATSAIAVGEVKSAFGSLEETNRMLDIKERLAPKLATARFGWRPHHIGRLLIVPDEKTIRRVVAAHSLTMDAVYPARSREVRAWLREPDRSLRGIWFLSDRRITPTVDH